MEGMLPANTGTMPAGTANQYKNARPTPHVSPVPGLVALGRSINPNSIPQSAPNNGPEAIEAMPNRQIRTPPQQPTTSPSKPAIAPSRDGFIGSCFLSFQIDRLHDI